LPAGSAPNGCTDSERDGPLGGGSTAGLGSPPEGPSGDAGGEELSNGDARSPSGAEVGEADADAVQAGSTGVEGNVSEDVEGASGINGDRGTLAEPGGLPADVAGPADGGSEIAVQNQGRDPAGRSYRESADEGTLGRPPDGVSGNAEDGASDLSAQSNDVPHVEGVAICRLFTTHEFTNREFTKH
jgi:hypothetical protein